MEQEFTVTRLKPHIYQLQNSVGNCATVVIGTEKALLFDTMTGLGDLKAQVRELTDLPLIVVNSHGHFDHVGGNWQFDRVYLNKIDWPLMDENAYYLPEVQRNMGRDLSHARESFARRDILTDLTEGMVFDLGGVTLEAVSLPGHTAGSMGLLLREDNILLVGDAISPEMCLFFPESLEPEDYIRTLNKIMKMEISGFIQGHFTRLFSARVLPKLLECAHLPERGKGMAYTNSLVRVGKGRVHVLSVRDEDVGGIICIITKELGYVAAPLD